MRAERRPAARLAERLWRWPLAAAAALMLLCGPAQALGRTGLVGHATLAALGLALVTVPLGLLGLRAPRPTPAPVPAPAVPTTSEEDPR